MAKVSYNGLIFPFADVTNFKHEVVYDEDSHTDYCLSKFDVSIMMVVNVAYVKLLDPDSVLTGLNGLTAVQIMNNIREHLSVPRRSFSVSFNGTDLIPGPIGAGSVDARNGPQPVSCEFTDLTNNTFLFTWRVVAHYWENLSRIGQTGAVRNNPGGTVLYNRWGDIQDIDENGFTTRTREGVFSIRSDNADGAIVDDLRTQMAIVGIPSGFTRKSARYHVQPDGLKMRYSLVDAEQFKMPPTPAKKAEGQITEDIHKGGGKRTLTCWCKLSGNKTDSQPQLIQTAVAVVSAKLNIRKNNLPVKGKGSFPETAKVEYGLYENWVKATITADVAIDTKRLKGINAFGSMDTTLPFSDGLIIEPSYPTFGTCGPLLEAAKYYDPSLRNVTIQPGGRNLTQGLQVGQAGNQVEPNQATPKN